MIDDNSLTVVVNGLRAETQDAIPGTRLSSVRTLMSRHRVSPVTVQRAVAALVREGLVEAIPGRGTFTVARPEGEPIRPRDWQSVTLGPARPSSDAVTELMGLMTLPGHDEIALSSGYLDDELQPTQALARAMARAGRRPGVWGRVPVEGLAELRDWFARESRGGYEAHETLICPGSQAALATAFRGLAEPGAIVVMESPTYVGAIAAAEASGARIVAVPQDRHGIVPELLDDALERTGSRLVYCQPSFCNPSGIDWSLERRHEVLAVVRDRGAFVIEDDWARDLGLTREPGPPLASLDAAGHVVYIRSLTKPVAPGFRIAALCAHGAAASRLRAARITDDFFVSGMLQETALDLVASPSWLRHLRALRVELIARRDALIPILQSYLGNDAIGTPHGGLHLWVRLPDGRDDRAVVAAARRRGVMVGAGANWFPGDHPAPYLRVSFGGASIRSLARAAHTVGALVNAEGAADGLTTERRFGTGQEDGGRSWPEVG